MELKKYRVRTRSGNEADVEGSSLWHAVSNSAIPPSTVVAWKKKGDAEWITELSE